MDKVKIFCASCGEQITADAGSEQVECPLPSHNRPRPRPKNSTSKTKKIKSKIKYIKNT